jgi:hypothetical protein
MTAQRVQKKSAAEVSLKFPIVGLVEGWLFRQREVSPGAFLVEGTDLWGRTVTRQGGDPDALLEEVATPIMWHGKTRTLGCTS